MRAKRLDSRILFYSILLIISLFFYFIILKPQIRNYHENHVSIHGNYLINPLPLNSFNNFNLTDTHGTNFTETHLKNHWTLLYLGFTHCASICPGTMQVLTSTWDKLHHQLAPEFMPQIVFVTIDPERDTESKLQQFIQRFNPAFIALRATKKNIQQLQEQLHLSVKKIEDKKGENYAFDHQAEIVLINPEMQIQAYFSYPQQPDQLTNEYLQIISLARKSGNK